MILLSKLMRSSIQLSARDTLRSFKPSYIQRGFKTNKDAIKISKLAPKETLPNTRSSLGISMGRNLVKCTIFAAGFTSLVFIESAVAQYEKMSRGISNQLQEFYDKFTLEDRYNNKRGEIRQIVNKWWNGLSDGHKVYWPILFINVVVFGCWKYSRLQPFMLKYFTFTPAARVVCWPMLFSTFSHHSFFHLGANMFVLHSFSSPASYTMKVEDFVAFYLGAGVLTSLGSAFVKVLYGTQGASLGASGAILALLGYFCSTHPDAELGIIFVPYLRVSADVALWAMIAFDAAGIIFRFKLFDHGAHLAGTLLGIFYAKHGQEYWESTKHSLWKYMKSIDQRKK